MSETGAKSAWSQGFDRALTDGEVDATTSCAKDLPSPHDRPTGTVIGAVLARDETLDALTVPNGAPYSRLADVPVGARVGTSTPQRAAQLCHLHPELVVVPIRDNANMRLAKLDAPDAYDALVLAATGHDERIDRTDRIAELLPVETYCPAAGAGVIVIEHRAGDTAMAEFLGPPHPRSNTVDIPCRTRILWLCMAIAIAR